MIRQSYCQVIFNLSCDAEFFGDVSRQGLKQGLEAAVGIFADGLFGTWAVTFFQGCNDLIMISPDIININNGVSHKTETQAALPESGVDLKHSRVLAEFYNMFMEFIMGPDDAHG